MKLNTTSLATGLIAAVVTTSAMAEVTVQSCDREVTFDTPPTAAISNDVNLTEMMLALGLADRMVGYTGISDWNKLDAELPELSERYPSKEVLIGADADFFFAGWNYGMKVGGEVTPETLAPFGMKVYELTESCIHVGKEQDVTMDLMYNDLLNLGKIFGVEERAEELVAGYQAELAEITAGVDANAEPVRAFVFDSGADTPFTAGHYAIPTAMIEAAGGVNVMDGFRKSWGTVSWEEVVAQDPEIVVIINYGELTAEDRMNIMRDNPALANIRAVKNDRFVVLEYVEATPGPRNIAAIRRLADAFHGE
ncbi:ABC transporter substrate-binding protein [Halocynthiibacter styelae]|uniref:ABC transporter substrate-binding protein n=1 Tax=Halocynthiibacter styelae TaxID=2761955 RepID=A0A8J7LP90_9RHOB|nr:ABC transporter substrate-binding protein [Paenihalocynthiibacter styelae]MBI1493226.1 ABC transporter substrate-binding protein [Paenihalocynthiibacter styelae]